MRLINLLIPISTVIITVGADVPDHFASAFVYGNNKCGGDGTFVNAVNGKGISKCIVVSQPGRSMTIVTGRCCELQTWPNGECKGAYGNVGPNQDGKGCWHWLEKRSSVKFNCNLC